MAFSARGLPNVNALWAALLVEELVRQGVGLFVVCPGSRSSPLAVAVARAAAEGKTDWLVHPDERAAAFVALGWGRATGRPAAVVTTSGTAVANLLPAVVEADTGGVPLLLLTADRPAELRETGANQTVRQPGIFGPFVRWSLDVPPPDADVDPAFVLTTAAHAAARSLAPAGPVHLNLAFREPLGAEPDGTDAAALLAQLGRWTESSWLYTQTAAHAGPAPESLTGLASRLARVGSGLVMLGLTEDEDVASAAGALAARLGWPLLPDVASRGRLGASSKSVSHYDLALASSAFARSHTPEAVVLIGGRPLSKRLLALIDTARPDPYVVVRRGPER
ncbi:MAG TPA: 2-succinyl-5-enolpyruvyl-6-hydroxy-3-cyclohexene-1-carboxylic-acid synthase, partial [Rubricoccaceae bacterium]